MPYRLFAPFLYLSLLLPVDRPVPWLVVSAVGAEEISSSHVAVPPVGIATGQVPAITASSESAVDDTGAHQQLVRDALATDTLRAAVQPLIEAHAGKVAVAIEHLDREVAYHHRADEPMPTASLIKLAVMIEAYRQVAADALSLDQVVTLRDEDKVPGSGILTDHFSAGARMSVRDAIRLMIRYSDNTATNLVVDQIGLPATAKTMEAWGYPQTKLHAKVYRRDTSIFPERSQKFGLGSTTARETVRLLRGLARRTLISEDASNAMLAHLRSCEDQTKLRRELPTDASVPHKSGAVSNARCDAGLLELGSETIAICVLTTENEDRSWSDENAANRLIGAIAKATYDLFATPSAESPSIRLMIGATGRLVADLQRTLNARLAPSPELGIDGDFGPATRAAVERFQSEHHLPVDGIVGAAMWERLGPLETEDAPVPDPDMVNAAQLDSEPADLIEGPPVVSCKAWAIADGKTGKVLASFLPDRRRHPASTTKIMTAYTVLRVAERDPTVMREMVTVSPAADQTTGSTADIRAGEEYPVGELLYGLLLPSGNDASVALAEHVGGRLLDGETSDTNAGYLRFIDAMNENAEALGLTESHYENPHGLTVDTHLTTARDLARLGWHAMQSETFRQIVATRQHGYRVSGPGGYQRNVVWKNTNRLLPIDGYSGVKTGTTQAAGACLVALGVRGDRSRLVVVLGATSSDGRYVDSRNLFRWAWSQP